jgi:probable rRNA maturation factor
MSRVASPIRVARFAVAVANLQCSRINRRRLIDTARHVLAAQRIPKAELSVALVDDAMIHQLNRRYLAHDYPTDVITFPLSDRVEPLSAEIVISVETAAREARQRGVPREHEVLLYLIHGILHLCGYDDSTPRAAARMRRRQQRLLRSRV